MEKIKLIVFLCAITFLNYCCYQKQENSNDKKRKIFAKNKCPQKFFYIDK